jgi:hypothetical protein
MAATKRTVARLYRQLEGALKRVPDDRRRQLATELAEQADREDSAGITEQLRAEILASGKSVFAISRQADIGYTKLRNFIARTGDLRCDSLDRLAAVLGLRLVKVGHNQEGGK